VLELITSLRSRFSTIVVTPHWGKEGEFASHPSPRQRTLARRWIEAGADAVLGHHPHAIHGREFVRGRPVYYSVGNFLFDHEEGQTYDLTTLGMAVRCRPDREPKAACWRHQFLLQERNMVRVAHEHELQAAEAYFVAVSDHLVDGRRPWSRLRWAKAVGPVYIAKCRKSWRRRLSRWPLATALLWLLWNVLPSTLLLRYGSLFPDRRVTAAAERLATCRGCVAIQAWSGMTGSELRKSA
jgi:poly-gamma-glutamate synthesis protein (capsule biosynthesis protein)